MVLSHLLHLQGIESVVLEAFRLLESVSNGGQPYIKRCQNSSAIQWHVRRSPPGFNRPFLLAGESRQRAFSDT